MEEVIIIKLVFGIFLSVGGAVLMLLAFALFYKYLTMEKRCTAGVKGVVKKYTLASRGPEDSGIHLPIVYYTVNNKEYKVIGPEYNWYISKSKSTPFSKNEMSYEEKPNGGFIINQSSNSFSGIRKNPMQELYPVNTELDVFYDPDKPEHAYVLKCPNKKWMFYLTFFSAIAVWTIDLLILFIL